MLCCKIKHLSLLLFFILQHISGSGCSYYIAYRPEPSSGAPLMDVCRKQGRNVINTRCPNNAKFPLLETHVSVVERQPHLIGHKCSILIRQITDCAVLLRSLCVSRLRIPTGQYKNELPHINIGLKLIERGGGEGRGDFSI